MSAVANGLMTESQHKPWIIKHRAKHHLLFRHDLLKTHQIYTLQTSIFFFPLGLTSLIFASGY